MHASSNPISTEGNSRRLWYAGLLLATTGIAFAVELTRIHVRLQSDPAHQSVCNINSTVNCDAVANSAYSVLLGLPLSVWGILAYVAAALVSIWGIRTNGRPAVASLWLLGAACVVSAIGLAAVSAFVLRAWCLFCMATWVVDVGLFLVASRLLQRHGFRLAVEGLLEWSSRHWKTSILVGVAGVGSLVVAYRSYGEPAPVFGQRVRAASLARDKIAKPVEGVDEDGLPYVGAAKPKLVITEFSDYQCPHCARAHELLRELVSAHPEAVRVVHRHFPLDNDCNPKIRQVFHTHACYYARLAVCAATLGKFWRANDYLFAHGRDTSPVSIEGFARTIEVPAAAIRDCLASKADPILKRDLEAGNTHDIDGTPTFIIGGAKFTGELPDDVLRQFPL